MYGVSVGGPEGVCGRGFQAEHQHRCPFPSGVQPRVAPGGRLPSLGEEHENPDRPQGAETPLGRLKDGGGVCVCGFWFPVVGKQRLARVGPTSFPRASLSFVTFRALSVQLLSQFRRTAGVPRLPRAPQASIHCSSVETAPSGFQ